MTGPTLSRDPDRSMSAKKPTMFSFYWSPKGYGSFSHPDCSCCAFGLLVVFDVAHCHKQTLKSGAGAKLLDKLLRDTVRSLPDNPTFLCQHVSSGFGRRLA